MTVATVSPPNSLANSPPQSGNVFEFSLSRSTGKFRFRLDGREWLCDTITGKGRTASGKWRGWEVVGNDNAKGNMMVRCRLSMQGPNAIVYLSPDVDVEALQAFVREDVLCDSHVRCCYNREGELWRLRDERTQILHSNEILKYQGIMQVDWRDGGTHIFHDGPVRVVDDVAWFAPAREAA